MMNASLSVVLLALCLGIALADQCTEVQPGQAASLLPSFAPDEFTVDIEMSSKERHRVIQTTLYYSRPKNMIRLSTMDQSVRSDLYYLFYDNEILAFDYSVGRGTCQVQSLSGAGEKFIVGGAKSDGKIQEPLGVIRMTGLSGFGNNGTNPIKVQKGPRTQLRSMAVDQYTSCQLWKYKSQELTMKVTHYFSVVDWRFPDNKIVPVGIKVEGSGTLKNQSNTMWHMYSFFNLKFSVDPVMLETPPGIYCPKIKPYPFPPSPPFIKFSAETIDNALGTTSYLEEIFDVDDKFAVMTMQDPASYSSGGGMGRRTYFRDYMTGLSFDMDNQLQSCAVRNISSPSEVPLPFDFIKNGRANQLSADAFFYKAGNTYQYLGQRTVRSIPCDTYVTKTQILNEPGQISTIEWYFALKGTRSWNDGTKFYKQGNFRLPVKFRMWKNDQTLHSTDINIYHVDYAKLRYGSIDIRFCFPNYASNYFQLVLPGAKQSVVDANIDQFKWDTMFLLANKAGVIWWRIADLKLYFEASDAIVEFELLDSPPLSGDSVQPINQISLQDATNNLKSAVSSGLVLKAFNTSTNDYTSNLPVSSSFQLQANKILTSDTGFSTGSLAGLGVAMVVIGAAAGTGGACFFLRNR